MTENENKALERIERLLEQIATALEERPSAAAAAGHSQPTFCGYACSWTEDRGLPAYLVTADGEMAYRHEQQGDCWWSVKDEQTGGYRRVLGFKLAEFDSLPASARFQLPQEQEQQPTQVEAQDPVDEAPAQAEPWPVDEPKLREMHALGRQLYRDEWPERGRDLIQAYSDGRTDTSAQLTLHECDRMINNLQGELRRVRGPEYAG